jgi:hypothetical protein
VLAYEFFKSVNSRASIGIIFYWLSRNGRNQCAEQQMRRRREGKREREREREREISST